MSGLREFLNSPTGKFVGVAAALVFVVLMVFVVKGAFTSAAENLSTNRVYICSETGKTFKHAVEMGEKNPIDSPHSGKKTGFPAEVCYWTKEGTLTKQPTYVLLRVHKGERAPTFCPDCGRLVTALNPPGIPGDAPPPTETEYNKSRGTR